MCERASGKVWFSIIVRYCNNRRSIYMLSFSVMCKMNNVISEDIEWARRVTGRHTKE
jgi:hypothetical protein